MDPLFIYGLIIFSLVLMAAEVFLPTGGILGVLALAGIVAGTAMAFYRDPTEGFITLVALFVILPVLGPVLMHYWPRTAMGKKFLLEAPEEDTSVASLPVYQELERLRGRYGRTVSALRPSGITEFDGRRVDTISEGDMIEAGQWVRCIDVRAGKVIVRQVDRPAELPDFDPGELRG